MSIPWGNPGDSIEVGEPGVGCSAPPRFPNPKGVGAALGVRPQFRTASRRAARTRSADDSDTAK